MENTALATINIEEIQSVIAQAPDTLRANMQSRDNAKKFANLLLEREKTQGMNPPLDLEMAKFVEKAKTTSKDLNGKRKPFTQMVDHLKKEFTACENDVKSLTDQIQARRNAYATQIEKEKQEKEAALRLKLAKEKAVIDVRSKVAIAIETSFQQLLLTRKQQVDTYLDERTLENIDKTAALMDKMPTTFNPVDLQGLVLGEICDTYLTSEEIESIIAEAKSDDARFNAMHTTYTNTLSLHIRSTKALIPSKKAELERIVAAGEEEKKRIEEDRAKREADKKIADKKAAAEAVEATKKAEEAKAASEKISTDLNGANPTIFETAYSPKVKVKNKINVLNPAGYALLFEFWMSNEGINYDNAKRERTTLGQMKAFCERFANTSGEVIDSPFIEYVEDITAS